MSLQALRDMKRGAPGGANKPRLNCDLACVASVSVRFRSKQRGTRVKDRAKNGVSERAGRGWGREETFPSPSPHFHFFALVSFLARPKPRTRSSVFLYSETKRKRSLRRLTVT